MAIRWLPASPTKHCQLYASMARQSGSTHIFEPFAISGWAQIPRPSILCQHEGTVRYIVLAIAQVSIVGPIVEIIGFTGMT